MAEAKNKYYAVSICINVLLGLLLIAILFFGSGCATILTKQPDKCQTTKPEAGQPVRKIRAGYLIADLLLLSPIGLGIDFITNKIYKPCEDGNKRNGNK